jgi:hypothetical protein
MEQKYVLLESINRSTTQTSGWLALRGWPYAEHQTEWLDKNAKSALSKGSTIATNLDDNWRFTIKTIVPEGQSDAPMVCSHLILIFPMGSAYIYT